ncbi:MAG: hypothetical protein WCI79_00610 [Candidatus Saccharibacteria bacterium]
MNSLLVIFLCVLGVFLISRFIALGSLKWKILPVKILSNGKRYHHFVWGNFLIVGAAFMVFGLGLDVNNIYLVVIFGIGLGLVLDEFPHWTGDVKELTRNIPIIPGAVPVVAAVELFILILLALKYLALI